MKTTLIPIHPALPLFLSLVACQKNLESCGAYNPFFCAGVPEDTSTGEAPPNGSGDAWLTTTSSGFSPDTTTSGESSTSTTGFGSSTTFESSPSTANSSTSDPGTTGMDVPCGDGVLTPDEDCDDGNMLDGDGCSAACQWEPMETACVDPETMEVRNIVGPKPGDMVITEFLANPSGDENDKEWFEVFVSVDIDLNGLKILGSAAPIQPEIDAAEPACSLVECLEIPAGSYVLFARNDQPAVNGGLPPVDCVFSVSLLNLNDGVAIAHGETLLHGVEWAAPQPEDIARKLDPDFIDPMYSDADGPQWCAAGDLGTPKMLNPNCP